MSQKEQDFLWNNFLLEMKEVKSITDFKKIPNNEKAIFLPHCLRDRECPAKIGCGGLECINCGKCSIGPFKKDAEDAGYKVFIVPGGSLVKKILEKNNFKAVLGVACNPELEQAFDFIKEKDLISLSVPLLKDGCVDTEVEWEKVREVAGL